MVLPPFVRQSVGASDIYVVDIPRDLDELVAWMYVLSKKSAFPVTMRVLGQEVTFTSLEEMLGFVMGVKRTSDVFRVAAPVAQ